MSGQTALATPGLARPAGDVLLPAAGGGAAPASAAPGSCADARELVTALGAIDPAGYRPHPLHASERIWAETNCYVDLWIELLHALGCDPLASFAFTLSSDFEGDQWTFFKVPPEDLRSLYGIEVAEMNAWRGLSEHVAEQLALGRLLTVEVDAFYLPDTREVSYRLAHQKTTITPVTLDSEAQTMRYFHNTAMFEVAGEDLGGALRRGADPATLAPYVELVKLERLVRLPEGELTKRSLALAREHLARRPASNPIIRLGERLRLDLEWLAGQPFERFHEYAFGTCRQCGANAEIAAAYLDWLEGRLGLASGAAAALRDVAEGAKTVQFGLARLAAGRRFDLDGALAATAASWDRAMDRLAGQLG